jgi:glycosyltransferase involved in cell wall biosynthesis
VTSYAFATTEYWPATRGGAGRLNADLVAMLVAAGHDVRVVLVASADVLPPDPNVHVVQATDAAGWDIDFMAASKAAAEGLAQLHSESPIDRIEIQDFDGLPFWTLTHRGDLGFADVPITIRIHGPVELQIEAMGVSTDELDVAAEMERGSFSMADAMIAPSQVLAALVTDRYGLEPERVLVGVPVIRELPRTAGDRTRGPRFTVIGRLSEVKGSHDMVNASVPMLREFPTASVTFVGSDGWSATANEPMRSWLSSMIPADVRDRIIFVDHVEAEELAAIISASTAVVAPSRFESFNLAVHEARRAGAPVVLPEIEAFSSVFEPGCGAEMYDGSVEGLTGALVKLARDPALVSDLSEKAAPVLGSAMHAYTTEMPEVWHRRSQGGLATAALARAEQVRFAQPELARHRQLLQSLIRRTPASVTGILNRFLPEAMRDRIRVAGDWDWDREEARQRKVDRWKTVEGRFAAGELGEVDSPKISVVIPCFNQGDFIDDALLSIFEQTMVDYEIVIVDDGSDDGMTPETLDALAFPRVTVMHQANVGLPGARNKGIAAARGEYVVTLDADDQLAPEYLEKLFAVLDADDSTAFAHCWARLFGDYQAIWATRPFNRFQFLLSNSVVGCVVLRKSAWEAVGGYDESMRDGNEDWDLWIRLTEAGFGNRQIREPLFWYRKHGVSMSVETEARYEDVLSSLSHRLPRIYTLDHMEEVKAASYPLLSILTDDDAALERPFGDTQIIHTTYDAVGDIVGEIRGKYVVWWPSTSNGATSVLRQLCEALEENEDAGVAETSGDHPIRVVRTWSLHDPAGPDESIATELLGTADRRLSPNQFPLDSWMVPVEIGSIEVHRQRPEEAGTIPEWVNA